MKSKIGLHVNGLWGGVDDWLGQARPQVLVSMDHNPDHWRTLRANLSNTFIIGRYGDINDGDATYYPTDGDTPATAAQKGEKFFFLMLPRVQAMGSLYDAWVGINEPVCHTEAHARNLAAWYTRWGDLMQGVPMKSIAYTFSQGVPEKEHWVILAEGLKHCDLLGLHEYWYPHFNSPDMIPWHVLRYRTAWANLPDEAKRQIVITECGADGGAGGIDTMGWQKFTSEGAYLGDLQAYDAELQKDDYMIGATIFQAGSGWASWDVSNARTIPAWIGSTGDPNPVVVHPRGFYTTVVVSATQPSGPTLPSTTSQPTATTQPSTTTAPSGTTQPAQPLPLDKARWFTEQAIRDLEANDGDGAHKILTETVIPWFYATAPQHSDNLENARAQTDARWFSEEATRRIEANQLTPAHDLLRDHVLAWLLSPGPRAIGILGIEAPAPLGAQAPAAPPAPVPAKPKPRAKKSRAAKPRTQAKPKKRGGGKKKGTGKGKPK